MQVIETVREMRSCRAALDGSVGLVPTMGFLHEGHLSLVRTASAECDHVVVSIFVNPTQFGADEDLGSYPRDTDRDLRLLADRHVRAVFAPTLEEMYPPGDVGVFVDPGLTAKLLEGAARPGHFRGVATVVAKLFNIVQPESAYFGRKDAQQLVVIRTFADALKFPVRVVGLPIVREPDGLAMSSRNVYLTADERRAAPTVHRALQAAAHLFELGERRADRLRAKVAEVLAAESMILPEYVSVANPGTLHELECVGDEGALLSLAARLGRARLIDNVTLGDPDWDE